MAAPSRVSRLQRVDMLAPTFGGPGPGGVSAPPSPPPPLSPLLVCFLGDPGPCCVLADYHVPLALLAAVVDLGGCLTRDGQSMC